MWERYPVLREGSANCGRGALASAAIERAAPDPAQIRRDRPVGVDVDAGVHGGQPALGPSQLEPRHHLLLWAVAPQLGICGTRRRSVDEFIHPCLERPEGGLERVEAKSLDARPASNGERPVGYER
jgi:hypothetical protein